MPGPPKDRFAARESPRRAPPDNRPDDRPRRLHRVRRASGRGGRLRAGQPRLRPDHGGDPSPSRHRQELHRRWHPGPVRHADRARGRAAAGLPRRARDPATARRRRRQHRGRTRRAPAAADRPDDRAGGARRRRQRREHRRHRPWRHRQSCGAAAERGGARHRGHERGAAAAGGGHGRDRVGRAVSLQGQERAAAGLSPRRSSGSTPRGSTPRLPAG